MSPPWLHASTGIWIGGTYRHFKGGVYVVVDIAISSDVEEFIVIYKNVHGDLWVRRAVKWNEPVKWPDDQVRARFVLETICQPAEAEDLSHLFKGFAVKSATSEETGTTPTTRATGKE